MTTIPQKKILASLKKNNCLMDINDHRMICEALILNNYNKVLFIITTDGYENSSKEYNKEKIKNMIEKHSNWEFIYMGANIDSYKEGSNIGIRCDNIANYEKKKGTKKMFEALKCASNMVYEDRLSSDWKSNLE